MRNDVEYRTTYNCIRISIITTKQHENDEVSLHDPQKANSLPDFQLHEMSK